MALMYKRRMGDGGAKVRGCRGGSSHFDLNRGKGQEVGWLIVQSRKSL